MKVIQKTFASLFASVVVFLGFVNVLFAQQDVDSITEETGDLRDFIISALQWLIGLAGLVAAAVLIFNGYLYITAGGDDGKIQKATKGITYAIIGLIIVAISFLIVNFVIANVL